jgi:hypothetical protein
MCTRGDKCKYSHDISTIIEFNSKEKGICFDHLRNQCHRGVLCRFSHDLSSIAMQCQVSKQLLLLVLLRRVLYWPSACTALQAYGVVAVARTRHAWGHSTPCTTAP